LSQIEPTRPMRKVGSDEYREHADYRRADAIKQLKSDKKQWICGQGKQQRTNRQSPEPDEEQRPATPTSRLPANQGAKRATTIRRSARSQCRLDESQRVQRAVGGQARQRSGTSLGTTARSQGPKNEQKTLERIE